VSGVSLAVLITYHGEGELLADCLRSLDAGEFVPDEVLIFDDASEVPLEVAGAYRFPVRAIRSVRNLGLSAARNALVELTSCEHIHFHDADDLFVPAWMRRVMETLAQVGPVEVVYCEVNIVGADGLTLERERVQQLSTLQSSGDLVEFAIRGGMLVPAGVYRRAAFVACGGFDPRLRIGEDFEFNVRFALTRPRFAVLDEPLVLYRRRPGSLSSDLDALLVSFVDGVESLSGWVVEERYRRMLADKAAIMGTWLFQRGHVDAADRAFRAAARAGGTDFSWRNPVYRLLARHAGPLAAERADAVYRRVVPLWAQKGLHGLLGARPTVARGASGARDG
jgi:glycosyltransferase involved in cell wall biosynthesis